MKTKLFTVLALLLLFSACKKDVNDTPPAGAKELTVRTVATGLKLPWEILWMPDGQLLVTEREGNIIRIDPTTGAKTTLLSILEVVNRGEGGLLGMTLHPQFSANPYVYVVYNYLRNNTYLEKVVRFTYNGSTLTTPTILLDNIAAGNIHNGSRLKISSDLKLFITTGDAGNTATAQNVNSLNGKVLRINLDGSIPADNPTPNSAVWSVGHRNAQGLVFANQKLYSSEHGANTNDEINIIRAAGNFGWPNVEGKCDSAGEQGFCTANNVVEPIYSWTPTIAPSGMDYYNHDLIPQFKNSLLVAVLKGSVLIQLQLNQQGDQVTNSTEHFKNTYGRLRDVSVAPNGKVYFITSNGNDQLLELAPVQ